MASIRGSRSVLAKGQKKLYIPSSQRFYVTTTHFHPHKSELLGGCHDTVPGCASSDCIILCGCLEAFSLERVMNLGENRIGMRIPRSAWFLCDLRFPHS